MVKDCPSNLLISFSSLLPSRAFLIVRKYIFIKPHLVAKSVTALLLKRPRKIHTVLNCPVGSLPYSRQWSAKDGEQSSDAVFILHRLSIHRFHHLLQLAQHSFPTPSTQFTSQVNAFKLTPGVTFRREMYMRVKTLPPPWIGHKDSYPKQQCCAEATLNF